MIALNQHIQSLLLRTDCLTIPGLGGFLTHHVAARIVEGEGIFLPPYRAVAFNAHLELNDGLLIQSYMQTYELSYPDASKLVASEVDSLKEQLLKKGIYEFTGIGTLRIQSNGQYEFSPNEAGVLSPQLYGLDALRLPQPLVSHHVPPTAGAVSAAPTTKDRYTFSINKRLVHLAATAAIISFFFFLLTTPLSTLQDTPHYEATFAPSLVFEPWEHHRNVAPKQSIVRPQILPDTIALATSLTDTTTTKAVLPVPNDGLVTQAQAKDKAPDSVLRTKKVITATQRNIARKRAGFTIVLASATTPRSAAHYVAKLQRQGHTEAYVHSHGKMTRVLFSHFDTEEAAIQTLREMRSAEEEWQDAWVMRLP